MDDILRIPSAAAAAATILGKRIDAKKLTAASSGINFCRERPMSACLQGRPPT